MHRLFLYFVVSLFAFGIGSFVAFRFYWQAEKEINSTQPIGSLITETSNSETPETLPRSKPTITCRDEKLLPIWNELTKTSNFQEREKDDYFTQDADCSEMLEVQKIDLNGDGQKEIVLWGKPRNLCGSTGNCNLWIYEKKNDHYVLLLESYGYNDGKEKLLKVNDHKTNKYRNILLRGHSTGYETTEHYYEFDGKQYQERKCLFISYHPNPKGDVMTCQEAWKEE